MENEYIIPKAQPIMPNQTVLEFVHVFFDREWNAVADPVKVTYTPIAAQGTTPLYVVTQEPTGILMTYLFQVDPLQQVWVSEHENLIYIPKPISSRNRGYTIP